MGWMRFAKIFVLALIFGQINQCFAAKKPKDAATEVARALGTDNGPRYTWPTGNFRPQPSGPVARPTPQVSSSRLTTGPSSVSYGFRPTTRAGGNSPQASSSSPTTSSALTTRLSSSVPPQSLVDQLEQRRAAEETGFDYRSTSSPASAQVPEQMADRLTLSAQGRDPSLDDLFSGTLAPSRQRIADLQTANDSLNVSSARNLRVPSAGRRERRAILSGVPPVSVPQPAPAPRALVDWLDEIPRSPRMAPRESYSQELLGNLYSIPGSVPSSSRSSDSGFLRTDPLKHTKELDSLVEKVGELIPGGDTAQPFNQKKIVPDYMPSMVSAADKVKASENMATASAQFNNLQKIFNEVLNGERRITQAELEDLNLRIQITRLVQEKNLNLMQGNITRDETINADIAKLQKQRGIQPDAPISDLLNNTLPATNLGGMDAL